MGAQRFAVTVKSAGGRPDAFHGLPSVVVSVDGRGQRVRSSSSVGQSTAMSVWTEGTGDELGGAGEGWPFGWLAESGNADPFKARCFHAGRTSPGRESVKGGVPPDRTLAWMRAFADA